MWKTWFLAMRPWTLTAAFVPVALGTVLAWNGGEQHVAYFLLTLLGGTAVQAGTNFMNTYGDYVSGVDSVESAKTCPQLVRGVVSPKAMKMAAMLSFGVAALCGIPLVYLRGWPILACGALGILAGYSYTAGLYPYKYKGWGSLFVFFLMGPLMVWPAYYIQTGQFSWLPLWASLPVSFLVAAILHSNDLRDMEDDAKVGIQTAALYLGFKKSYYLYFFLYTAAFVSLAVLIFLSILPWTAALPVILIPAVCRLFANALAAYRGSAVKLDQLVFIAAKFHFQFGLLLIVGLVLQMEVFR